MYEPSHHAPSSSDTHGAEPQLDHSPQTPGGTLPANAGWSISFLGEIPVKPTAPQSELASAATRALAVSSSELLMSFARALWSEKTPRTHARTLPGLGGDFDPNWNALVTRCCPSDFGRAALGLSINGTACSCSVSLPTPTASDWRGGKRKRKAGSQANLRDEFTQKTGLLYLHPEDFEAAAGLPTTWTELRPLETVSTPLSPNLSADA